MQKRDLEQAMEGVDVFAEQFELSAHPFAVTLTFIASVPYPPGHPEVVARRNAAAGPAPQLPPLPPILRKVATVRMTPQHFAAMVFTSNRHLRNMGAVAGAWTNLPPELLAAMGIPQAEWDGFWGKVEAAAPTPVQALEAQMAAINAQLNNLRKTDGKVQAPLAASAPAGQPSG